MAFGCYSCEKDLSSVKLRPGTPVLNVDGWITDRPGGDTIRLTTSADFFNQNATPVVRGAALRLTDNHEGVEELAEVSPGRYVISQLRATQGYTYKLQIQTDGETYTASSSVARISPVIDSLTFVYRTDKDSVGYRVRIWGQELAGTGDACRIFIYRNNNLQNVPDDLNIYNDDNVEGNYIKGLEMNSSAGFKKGDVIRVEEWSLDPAAYNFYNQLKTQINNGGLFSAIPANIPSNVVNTNPASAKVATGYFGASLSALVPAKTIR